MNEKTLRVLEYQKILNMLTTRAVSSLGQELCSTIKPSSSLYEVKERLQETSEACDIILKWGTVPLDGIRNIKEALKRVRMGFVLSPKELLDICDLMRCTKKLKAFMKDGSKAENYLIIAETIDSLFYIKKLEEEIEKAIVSEEEISDKASQKLYGIRRSIRDKNGRIKDKLQSMLSSYGKYLQDPIVTIRGGRYVIPVKAEYRSSVPGLIHDQSASGSTFFIEPMAVVEMNNDIKELMLQEKEEVERILAELSVLVSEHADSLEYDNDNIGYLDFLMAKGKFALDLNCTIPEVNDSGIINIKAARHPLLDPKTAVPIGIKLGEGYKALVITGPNTGGKTVTLKTTGLLTLMTMSGLAIPARDGSQVSLFNKVYADIGDEQSIEQSLSTFSSHMTNIVDILENADDKSLVLVDELGAGTDPTEGAALAMAILKDLYGRGCTVVGTTHYSEIKVFAMEEKGFENASVEFNVETLRPTYRLLIGIPGKSNAFEISRRLGLNDEIIKSASEMISKDAAKFEDVIQNLQDKTLLLESEIDEIQRTKREVQELKKDLSEKKYKLESQKDSHIRKAQEDAKKIVRQAKIESDNILKELNELRKKAVDSMAVREAEEMRKKLQNKLEGIQVKESDAVLVREGMEAIDKVVIGEEVFVTTFSQRGIVMTEPDSKGEVMVQVGVMKVNIPIAKLLREVATKKKIVKNASTKIIKQKAMQVSTSIDVRGQNLDEALYNIDKYLDDAFLAGIEKVMIIHGKGTGILRDGIQSYLRKNTYVSSIRLGDLSEGGSGVTVAEIKK